MSDRYAGRTQWTLQREGLPGNATDVAPLTRLDRTPVDTVHRSAGAPDLLAHLSQAV
jgi:hypothetical protein